jgi:hypothetical protein
VPCSGHAVMAQRGRAVRYARVGRADHAVTRAAPTTPAFARLVEPLLWIVAVESRKDSDLSMI